VWHGPRSNWMKRESTGTHFTLKLAKQGTVSVGGARFKSLLAHVSDWPRVLDLGLRPLRDSGLLPSTPQMFGCRRCCGVFLLVDERCTSQSPKSCRVRRAINEALGGLREFSEPAVPVLEAAGAGHRADGRAALARVAVGQADWGLTQRATLPPASAERWGGSKTASVLVRPGPR
jgi:hypothetical protein